MFSNPKFRIFKSAANQQFYYHLQSVNGEKILSGEGYSSNQACRTGIASVKLNSQIDSRYDRRDGYGNFTFNLKGGNGEIIGRSENYTTQANRENGIAAVKRDAPNSPIEDLS
jgi:uncharacterized protein